MESLIAFTFRVAVVVAMAITASMPASAQDSCAALKAMSQTTDAFASLRGERLPTGNWRAKLIPAGFKACTVDDRKGDAVVSCTNDFAESDKPATLLDPVALQFRDCLGQGWIFRKVLSTGEDASALAIYNDSPVEFEVRFEKERSGAANAMGLATGAWKYRVALKAFTPSKDAPPASLGPRDRAAFCSTLKSLLAAAPEKFKNVKGKQISEGRWQPALVLQGLNNCRVSQLRDGTTYYSCEVEFESRAALASAQRQLASDSVACLGSEWRQSRRPKADGVWRYVVDRKDDGPEVNIRGSADDDTFTLNFDVDPE